MTKIFVISYGSACGEPMHTRPIVAVTSRVKATKWLKARADASKDYYCKQFYKNASFAKHDAQSWNDDGVTKLWTLAEVSFDP